MAESNGHKGFEVLSRYMEQSDWKASRIAKETSFKADKEGDLCPIIYYFQLKVDLEQFLFYVVPHVTLLPDMLPSMAEFVCRANHGLRLGNFELDFSDARLSFKSSLNFKGVALTPKLLDNTIQPALTAFDEFFPAAAQVIAGLKSPADAIREAEYGDE